MKWLVFYTLLFFAGTALGQPFTMVKDINTSNPVSTILNASINFVELNGKLIFETGTPNYGSELGIRDSATGKVHILKDIYPGMESSEPNEFIEYNGFVYFQANDGVVGKELWRTDGTTEGTILVKDINPGRNWSNPGQFIRYNNELFFSAAGGLWKTDGTEQGTVMIKGSNLGTVHMDPSEFTVLNGILYFAANDPVNGRELWRSDGTESGTYMFFDASPGIDPFGWPHNGMPRYLNVCNNLLFFAAYGPGSEALWRTDGTVAGTVSLKPKIGVQNFLRPLESHTVLNNKLYFSTFGFYGYELWTTDGSQSGTTLVKALSEIILGVGTLLTMNGAVYVVPAAGGDAFWRTNGTPEGTQQLFAAMPNIENGGVVSDEHNFYFIYNIPGAGRELWSSDGTTSGTHLVKDITPGAASSQIDKLRYYKGQMYFHISDPYPYNGFIGATGIWKTDGTANGTQNFISAVEMPVGSDAKKLIALKDNLYFFANDSIHGNELWRSDGSGSGTILLKDITSGAQGSNLRNPVVCGNSVFFSANNHLWKTDGTETGTVQVHPGVVVYDSKPVTLSNRLYFAGAADSSNLTFRLWVSDGSSAGSRPITSMPSVDYLEPKAMTIYKNTLYFSIPRGDIWKVDTSTLVAVRVEESSPETNYYLSNQLAATTDHLYFVANEETHGSELRVTDGVSGTIAVLDVNPGPHSSDPDSLFAIGNILYFIADDSVHGKELWKTDGTQEGTMMVKDIQPGPQGSIIGQMTNVDGVLYFNLQDSTFGTELWKSDGTAAGTSMVKDIWPGLGDNRFNHGFTTYSQLAYNGRLFFTRNDGIHGEEPWISDGTENGTVMLQDIVGGSGGSGPNGYTIAGNKIFFTATIPASGLELWVGNLEDLLPKFQLVFTGSINKHDVLLNWKTTNESKLVKFEVQRSRDGRQFTRIGEVLAKGGTGQHVSYDFTDENVNRQHAHVLYYRLAIIDEAGELSYSDTIRLVIHPNIQCAPNPVHKDLNISISLPENDHVNIVIYNQHGVTVLEKEYYFTHGTINKTINVEQLPTGLYYLRIKGNSFSEVLKFLKL
jgi:trimeric autotransporter adhesin